MAPGVDCADRATWEASVEVGAAAEVTCVEAPFAAVASAAELVDTTPVGQGQDPGVESKRMRLVAAKNFDVRWVACSVLLYPHVFYLADPCLGGLALGSIDRPSVAVDPQNDSHRCLGFLECVV